MVVGRLAPTPSGRLHLGNALAFGMAWLSVRAQRGRLVLRMEDLDRERSRRDIESSIREDLQWLGLDWDDETPNQRDRDYSAELSRLDTYRCRCTRTQLAGVGAYPGTCRDAGHTEGAIRWRLPTGPVAFVDRRWGPRTVDPTQVFGDPVLRRRDGGWAYPLAVVADDLRDGVTEVVRGADLLDYTAVQVPLWEHLGGRPPSWLHSPLLLGADGAKLSKSHGSSGIAELRAAGATRADVWRRLLPLVGLHTDSLTAAAEGFTPGAGLLGPVVIDSDGRTAPRRSRL
jgi:glutamyl/glutaminyl-tRNA synthetase